MGTETIPQTGDYICIDTEFGPKVRVVERRVKHPQTGDRCLLCVGVLYPLTQCRPLGWVPTGGQTVILNMPWHTAHWQQGTMTRIYSIEGMPLAESIPRRAIAVCSVSGCYTHSRNVAPWAGYPPEARQ